MSAPSPDAHGELSQCATLIRELRVGGAAGPLAGKLYRLDNGQRVIEVKLSAARCPVRWGWFNAETGDPIDPTVVVKYG